MSRQLRTLLLIGVTLATGGAVGCFSSTGDRGGGSSGSTSPGSQTCLANQYFQVQWGIDRGAGTAPLTCDQSAAAAYSVILTTSTGDSLQVAYYLAPCDPTKFCVDGSPCYYYGETGSVAAGTSIVSASLLSAGTVVDTVPTNQASGVPQCSYSQAAFLFTVP